MPVDPRTAAGAVARSSAGAPGVGIVLGSGLGGLGERIGDAAFTRYGEVPGMPVSKVAGHAGRFVLGELGGRSVAAMQGRVHMYEGHDAAAVAFGVRVLHALGCRTLVVTNAAGGLNPAFRVGDLMAIADHVFFPGLAGHNPLIGVEGERFVSMTFCYDSALLELAAEEAGRLGVELRRGVYAMVAGPSFETSAELRLLRTIGADAVGMSTAPEVIVARQLGMRVLGFSCITNQAFADAPVEVDHHEVLAAGDAAGPRLQALVEAVLRRI